MSFCVLCAQVQRANILSVGAKPSTPGQQQIALMTRASARFPLAFGFLAFDGLITQHLAAGEVASGWQALSKTLHFDKA